MVNHRVCGSTAVGRVCQQLGIALSGARSPSPSPSLSPSLPFPPSLSGARPPFLLSLSLLLFSPSLFLLSLSLLPLSLLSPLSLFPLRLSLLRPLSVSLSLSQ